MACLLESHLFTRMIKSSFLPTADYNSHERTRRNKVKGIAYMCFQRKSMTSGILRLIVSEMLHAQTITKFQYNLKKRKKMFQCPSGFETERPIHIRLICFGLYKILL